MKKLPVLGLIAAAMAVGSGFVANHETTIASAGGAADHMMEMTVNYGTSYNYGSISSWVTGSALEETVTALPGSEEYHLFRDVVTEGKDFLGDLYDSIEATEDDGLIAAADSLHFDKTNANLYVKDGIEATLSIGYDMGIFTKLHAIATSLNKTVILPALTLDDSIAAMFSVSPSTAKVIVAEDTVKSLSETYHVENFVQYYTSGGSPVTTQVYNADIAFTFKKGKIPHVSKIGTLSCMPVQYGQSSGSDYLYDYTEGFVEGGFSLFIPAAQKETVFSLPYEITYFDYNEGHFVLGNSAYGERYGSASHRLAAKDIELSILAGNQWTTVHLEAMEYAHYVGWNTSNSEYANRFAYLSRPIRDDEVGGEGGLVRGYYVPFKQYDISKSSYIFVKSMTFYEKHDSVAYRPANTVDTTYTIPNQAIKFEYYAEQATARATYHFKGINISDKGVSIVTVDNTSWWTWILRVATGGLSVPYEYALAGAHNIVANHDKNIQRLYFNMYDDTNQLIQNAFKLDFKYQMGRKNVNTTGDNEILVSAEPYKDLDYHYEKCEVGTAQDQTKFPFHNVTVETNGFVSVEDDPAKIDGTEYSYYYQNIYETKNYSNFMCWWEPLSIWYKTTTGKTSRATAASDGSYAVEDPKGNMVVMTLDEPGKVQDVSYDEWLQSVKTNGTNAGIEDGERNDVDKGFDVIVSGVTDWFGSIGSTFDQWKTALGIALGVAGGAVVIFLLFKFFSGGNKTVIHVEGTAAKPKKGKRKRK